jgi:hypothetical protein
VEEPGRQNHHPTLTQASTAGRAGVDFGEFGAPQARRSPRNQKFADSPAEGTGFELPVRECNESGFAIAVAAHEELKVCRLVWEFFCQVVFWFVAGSLFGAERPFLVPSPAIRFAERAERCQGTEMLAQLSGLPLSVACVSQRLDA